jgi:hypothetical protein
MLDINYICLPSAPSPVTPETFRKKNKAFLLKNSNTAPPRQQCPDITGGKTHGAIGTPGTGCKKNAGNKAENSSGFHE